MAASTYVGVAGVNRKVSQIPVGVGGVNRACKSAWAGVAGVNRQVFTSGSPLSSKAVGSIVKIKENGAQTDFIVLNHGYPASGRTLLLRESIYDTREWANRTNNAYVSSNIDPWLNGDYLNLIDASVRAQIAAVNIFYTVGNENNTVTTLSRKVFLLSRAEVDSSGSSYANVEGTLLSYFNSDAKRIAYLNGVATVWWLRTPTTHTANYVWNVRTGGNTHFSRPRTLGGTRPAFTLPSTTLTNDNGEIIVA